MSGKSFYFANFNFTVSLDSKMSEVLGWTWTPHPVNSLWYNMYQVMWKVKPQSFQVVFSKMLLCFKCWIFFSELVMIFNQICNDVSRTVFLPVNQYGIPNSYPRKKISEKCYVLLPTNCLRVIDHFVGLVLKGLIFVPLFLNSLNILAWSQPAITCSKLLVETL